MAERLYARFAMKTSFFEIEGRAGRKRRANPSTSVPGGSSPSTAKAPRPDGFPIAVTEAYSGPFGLLRRIVRHGESAARGFWRARRASVAFEASLAMSAPVIAVAVLMEVVSAVYADDFMERAARAAARAVALQVNTQTDIAALQDIACDAMKVELHLDAQFDCGENWTVTIDTELTAQDLLTDQTPPDPTGDMVRVSVGWHRAPLSFGSSVGTDEQNVPNELAVAVARAEPVGQGS